MRSNSSGSITSNDEKSKEKLKVGIISSVVTSQDGHVTYVLTSNGYLFALGNKQNPAVAQFKKFSDFELTPIYIPVPVSSVILSGVATGKDHAIAWDEDGNVYGWGVNRFGCLGLESNQARISQTTKGVEVVESVRGAKVVACYIVEHASFAITYQGKVFHWGK